MANRYWVGGSDTWDGTAGSKWSTTSGGAGGAAEPTSADDVFFDAASGAVTVTVFTFSSNPCRNLTFTGFTGEFTGLGITDVYGDAVLGAGMTYSHSAGGFYFLGATGKLTTNGITITSQYVAVDFGGSCTLQDNLTVTGVFGVQLVQGTFDANNKNVTTTIFESSNTNARTLTMGSGTWTLTDDSTTSFTWNIATSTNLTLNANTSTIKFTNNSANQKDFYGGGKTYYNIWNATAGTGFLYIQDSNTFNDMKIDAGRTQIFVDSITVTVSSFTATGTAGNEIGIAPSGAGFFTFSKSSGTVSCNYLLLSGSHAGGGASWYAGANSEDVGGNTGWIFTAPPSPPAAGGKLKSNLLLLGV